MSKTIEEVRAIVATDQGYDSWEDFLEWEDADDVAYHLAIEYSNQQTQEIQEQNEELVEMYKECFEMFIPVDKWDEATEFLSTYGSGLAKDLCKKEKYNHLKSNTNETDKI